MLGFEKFFFQIALVFVVLLFVGQILLSYDNMRLFFSKVDQLEGDEIEIPHQDVISQETVMQNLQGKHDYYVVLKTLPGKNNEKISDDQPLEIHINEKFVAKIKDDLLFLYVNPGDLITIEGNLNKEKPVLIFVEDVHAKLLHPYKGYAIYTFGEGEPLGWVVVDDKD